MLQISPSGRNASPTANSKRANSISNSINKNTGNEKDVLEEYESMNNE